MCELSVPDSQIECLACKEYIDASECIVQDNGLVLCPNCGKDICNELQGTI